MCVFCVLNGSIYAQTADFTADTTKGCVPMQVSFTDLSSGNPVAWEWDMGDGSSHIYIQNPTFVYNHPGTYDVTLTVTYADNSKKLKTIKNYITASSGPYVNFSSDITTACQYQSITFSDTVIPGGANVKSLLWDFGDGGTSTQNNPGHSYRDAGQYKVSLTAYNQMGCATKTEKVSYVTIYPNPVADFMADSVFCVQSASETKSVNFVNNSSNFISSLWQFHDGTTSTQTNPTKVFGIGDHDVTLIVTSDKGCKDTLKKSDYISVHIFNADFTVSDTIVCDTNTQITFYGLYGVQYTWSFGDGANGIGMKPNHTYQKSGKYTVSLYATSCLGWIDTVV
ncbi:MAG: PKD domain-containing protein, partial [Bacteroidales bacterium]|nr:PKD domain-containing protein [Bacteroidales bacterium]